MTNWQKCYKHVKKLRKVLAISLKQVYDLMVMYDGGCRESNGQIC